jgi:hypothetical protein
MNIAFLTEIGFEGKVPSNHTNARTEFAWMLALNADHRYIRNYASVKDYDHVFIIFPKGEVYLNAVGGRLVQKQNPVSDLLSSNFIEALKQNNKKVHYVQEGPHWLYNDYELHDQIQFYNMLAECDSIFAHNESDALYYKGLFSHDKQVNVLPSLMIHDTILNIDSIKEDKVIIGGNFARWYGGFESYIVAQEFELPIWGQTSHATREGENQMVNLLPRVMWTNWMTQLSSFKYAIHLMPTAAAGTFSLNCAYFSIPCIGNEKVDTQRLCHPDLSVDVDDLERARSLAKKLKKDLGFYEHCSHLAKSNYLRHYDLEVWKKNIYKIL